MYQILGVTHGIISATWKGIVTCECPCRMSLSWFTSIYIESKVEFLFHFCLRKNPFAWTKISKNLVVAKLAIDLPQPGLPVAL